MFDGKMGLPRKRKELQVAESKVGSSTSGFTGLSTPFLA